MKIIKKQENFRDFRGTITDIFVSEPHEHCSIIFTKKGGIRGNHYHKLSRQFDFLVSGKMEVYGQVMGGKVIKKELWLPNSLVIWEPNEAHEFIALKDSVFVTFVDGPRGGDNFEKDTYRLEVPLHKEYAGGTR